MSDRRLPTFVIIGAMKAGTTSLWQALRAHPDVFTPGTKELHYFSNPDRLERGIEWYCEQFAGAGDALAIGEASTNYTKHPRRSGTAKRMADAIPEARLVYLVRDPIERIRSHYLHVVHRYGERRPLAEAVRADPEYVDVSRYRMQADQYLEHFARSQLLVLTSESLKARPAATAARVFEFIGVDPDRARTQPREVHRAADRRLDTPLTASARRVPGYHALRRLTPRPVRRLAARLLKPAATGAVDPTIPVDLHDELVATLRDDVRGIRELVDDPTFDGWGIA